jgi:DNA mismatch repair ATPase MutL
MSTTERKLSALPEDLRTHIRSSVAVASVCQAVEELIYNAIDAKANTIAVRLDLSKFKVQVGSVTFMFHCFINYFIIIIFTFLN